MNWGVIQFPGSCDERDALNACERAGDTARLIWHEDGDLGGLDAVVVPGGFSYGDYLRAGAIARFAPAIESVIEFAERGGPVLGICNGFQVLCEAGLLPGALTRNANLRFTHREQHLRVEGTGVWAAAAPGTVLRVPIKNGEGRYVHPDPAGLLAAGQVLVRYCDADGTVSDAANPNGSAGGIAGVLSPAGNVAGLMPHPEHAVDPLLGSTDGRALLGAVLARAATA